MYAQVIFSLPFRNDFTYFVPEEFSNEVKFGVRVVVPFGKRTLTGFVVGLSETTDVTGKIKPIRDVLDTLPVFDETGLKFFKWLSDYYLCSLGEALKNVVPYGSDVESKKKIIADCDYAHELFKEQKSKSTLKAKLLDALSIKESYTISQLQKAVRRKSIYSALNTLEKEGVVTVFTEVERAKVRAKKRKFVKLSKPIDEVYEIIPEIETRSPKQVVVLLELISAKDEDVQVSELLKKTKTSASTLNSLEKKGIVEQFEKEVERVYREIYTEEKQTFELTLDQQKVIEEVEIPLNKSEFSAFVLHGVTGSGKTQVYIELAKKAIAGNKTALILVPEISLTPQITSRFYNTFGEGVAVIHSRISIGERYDTWRGIIAGKYKIVIGPRSALFAPLKNIGLIVVDEEHDHSYKQYDNTPRYHARDAAVVRAQISGCPIVLGSATPSVESRFNTEIGKYKLLKLEKRIDDAKMPAIRLVDISIERKRKTMESVFSPQLIGAIAQRKEKNEGVILLQNRRGFATNIYCEDCGEIVMCPDCSVSMVHHLKNNLVKCHYCGISAPTPKGCPNCGSLNLKFFGTGTQKVEDELAFHIPEVRIERVDSDTINRRGKLSRILGEFRDGKIDVLVGTQMVSKGLDFSNVTLVGVISAETTLWIPDFRADERTFQLLTQVAGRAGRSEKPGEVIIQTQKRNQFVLQKVLYGDYSGFYESEIEQRKKNGYPPFTKLCLIETRDLEDSNARGAINDFFNYLKKYGSNLQFGAPSEAVIYKIKGYYRYHLIIKSSRSIDPGGKLLRDAVLNSAIEFNRRSRYKNVKLTIDIDPQNAV